MAERWCVVVEFNQASGRPRIADDDVYDEQAAAELAAELLADAQSRGRRESYTVFELVEVDGV